MGVRQVRGRGESGGDERRAGGAGGAARTWHLLQLKRRPVLSGRFFLLPAAALSLAAAAVAFVPLDFPSTVELQGGSVVKWTQGSKWFMGDGDANDSLPFILSYKVDDDFMQDVGGAHAAEVQAGAHAAAVSALEEWSQATGGAITFEEAPWSTVTNTVSPTASDAEPLEGPGEDEWLADFALPEEERQFGLDILPAWGANIEFFSRPNGWVYDFDGKLLTMHSGTLGFAVVNTRSAPQGRRIVSAEIYLNSSQTLWSIGGEGNTFDLETVILHEIGHTLGLDHPNEAVAEGSENLDPLTFQFGAAWCSCDVMHGQYTGVKRELTDDEIGAMAFYHPPMMGDVTFDWTLTLADVAVAIDLVNGVAEATPREVAAMDFLNDNGRVDLEEVAQLIAWVNGTKPYTPTGGTRGEDLSNPPPSTVDLSAAPSPQDVGKGGRVDVTLTLANPDAVPFSAWQLELAYDPAIFSDPQATFLGFPDGAAFTGVEIEPGLFRLTALAFDPETSLEAELATVSLEIDLSAAVAAGSAVFLIENAELVVDDGSTARPFGEPGETLNINDAVVIASDFDADGNGVVDKEDLYAWHTAPIDVDQNGVIDDADRLSLSDCLRIDEIADIAAERVNP